MKRAGLWAIGIGALVSVGPLAVGQGYAGEDEAKCTLATLKGLYLFASTGTVFPPAFGMPEGTPPSVSNAAGYHILNGDGTGEDRLTFLINGVVFVQPTSAGKVSYPVNSDCTGTYSSVTTPPAPPGPVFNLVVSPDGGELFLISSGSGTSNGFAVEEGPDWRVGSE
jgi:hypothetical protein